jgi:hypothetical protein
MSVIDAIDQETRAAMTAAAKGEVGWLCADCGASVSEGMPDACVYGHQRCTEILQRDKARANATLPPVGHPLQRLGSRLADLLDEDQFNNCEDMLLQAWNFDQVITAIAAERAYQDDKWGSLEMKQQSVAGYLLVLERTLDHAKTGWVGNMDGRQSVLSEILQLAAVAVACLQQHGTSGNPL